MCFDIKTMNSKWSSSYIWNVQWHPAEVFTTLAHLIIILKSRKDKESNKKKKLIKDNNYLKIKNIDSIYPL